MTGDYNKMLSATPDQVVFNGVAFQYNDQTLPASEECLPPSIQIQMQATRSLPSQRIPSRPAKA